MLGKELNGQTFPLTAWEKTLGWRVKSDWKQLMQLHEFMTSHRREILETCHRALESDADGVDDFVCHFFDEMVRAMRRDSGVPESYSPLPGRSDTAARLGAYQQRAGIPVTKVTAVFAAISQAVAKTGAIYELSMTAEECATLYRCLDAGIATSVENYWRRDQAQAAERHTEHYGFLAHELRNALGNANMAFKLMRAGKLGVEGRTGDVLSRNLTRMAALVAQWIGSVQAAVPQPADSGPIHVATMLRDVEASLLPDRGVSIVLETDELLFVSGDDMLFHSAVSNLVHNAVKFSKPKSVVQLKARSEPVDTVLIEVSDECGGIGGRSLAELCRPVERLQQGDSRGLGLGLAITKLAVETLAGELSLLERPGQGCVFSLRFPLLRPS